jgi:type I restriction enzyme S subunit
MVVDTEFQQTEVGLIPQDWIIEKIGAFADVTAGGTPSTMISKYWNGDIRWMNSGELNFKRVFDVENRITELGLSNSATRLIPEKCVLIGLAGQGKTRGTVAMNMVELCTNQSIAAIHPSKLINQDYLFYNLDNRYFELRGLSTGDGGRGGLNLTIIKNLFVACPPLPQQAAIATALSDMDELITQTEKLIEKKKAIKQGVMQELLRPKDGWVTKNLGEVAVFRRGSFPQPYGLDKWYDDINGEPFVQVFDVDNDKKLKPETKRYISVDAQKMSVFAKKGTIVLTIQGSIGRIAITQYDAFIDRTLLVFESFKYEFNDYFFMHTIHQLFEIEKQSAPGGIIKTITKNALKNFEITFPEIDEQVRIGMIIKDIESDIVTMENKLQKLNNKKQGMMQALLTGKIRLV